ncbi:MAG: protein phosphatase 2C family protein [Chloroflexi bacterium]|nr:protein phosphatase 2C family protein [Chloroflexota bacterium]
MSDYFTIRHHPVFKKGVFKDHPALFNAYFQNTPEHLKRKHAKARRSLTKYEGTISWPVITASGFCGATHPGASKVFNGIMLGPYTPVYNSDCMYVNPSQSVFAVSDPPGMTTVSRKLFEQLDGMLKTRPTCDLEAMVNELNREMRLKDRATLTLVSFVRDEPGAQFARAQALIAGDTHLFHGNVAQGRMSRIEGNPSFWGSSSIYFEPVTIDLADEDFFIIASDGITALRSLHSDVRMEDVLWRYLDEGFDDFAFRVTQDCNRVFEETKANGMRAWFGGGDNTTVCLVCPAKLGFPDSAESIILGGYMEEP